VSGDAAVFRDPVDHRSDVIGAETPGPSVNPPRHSLPLAHHKVCHSSNCDVCVAEDCHCLHSKHLQYMSLVDCHVMREPYHPQFSVEDHHSSIAQIAAVRLPFISEFTRCCVSHLAIV